MAVVIDTARLQLQELDIDTHLNDLHEVESDERIATLLKGFKTKKSIVETRAWLQARLKDPSKPWINVLAIVAKPSEQTDPHAKPKAIGMVGVPRLFRDESELGYGLHPDFWGRGLATEAVNAFLKVHFKDPNASGLMALVHCEHWGSSKVLEKLGFVEVDREEEDVVYKLQRTAFEERNKLE